MWNRYILVYDSWVFRAMGFASFGLVFFGLVRGSGWAAQRGWGFLGWERRGNIRFVLNLVGLAALHVWT